jgi:hypothetical protein
MEFKDNLDEMMYRIIIGSANWSNPEEKLEGEDPKALINDARQHFQNLQEKTTEQNVRADLTALVKLLGILDDFFRLCGETVQRFFCFIEIHCVFLLFDDIRELYHLPYNSARGRNLPDSASGYTARLNRLLCFLRFHYKISFIRRWFPGAVLKQAIRKYA